jgi:hypothetical protein
MPSYGYTLFCELNRPTSLVEQAVRAEEAGFVSRRAVLLYL